MGRPPSVFLFLTLTCSYIILRPCRPVSSNNPNTFVMLNNSRICLLAFTTSSRHPRVRAETCSVTTAPNPELSIIGTSFKSKTIRPFFPQASSISIFNSGTFSLVNLPKHSTTQPSSTSRRLTRNPRAELAPSIPAISTLRSRATPPQPCPALYLISLTLPSALHPTTLRAKGSAGS
jgi:hypothetical protein